MFCVCDADPWRPDDSYGKSFLGCGYEEVVAQQIVSIEAFINSHCAAQERGALGSAREVLDGLDGTEQDGRSVAFSFGHHIHAEVHPVNEIDVRVTGWTEHDFGSVREPFGRVGGEVVLAQVRFDLNDAANALAFRKAMHEICAEQLAGDEDRIPVVERAGKLFHQWPRLLR